MLHPAATSSLAQCQTTLAQRGQLAARERRNCAMLGCGFADRYRQLVAMNYGTTGGSETDRVMLLRALAVAEEGIDPAETSA